MVSSWKGFDRYSILAGVVFDTFRFWSRFHGEKLVQILFELDVGLQVSWWCCSFSESHSLEKSLISPYRLFHFNQFQMFFIAFLNECFSSCDCYETVLKTLLFRPKVKRNLFTSSSNFTNIRDLPHTIGPSFFTGDELFLYHFKVFQFYPGMLQRYFLWDRETLFLISLWLMSFSFFTEPWTVAYLSIANQSSSDDLPHWWIYGLIHIQLRWGYFVFVMERTVIPWRRIEVFLCDLFSKYIAWLYETYLKQIFFNE